MKRYTLRSNAFTLCIPLLSLLDASVVIIKDGFGIGLREIKHLFHHEYCPFILNLYRDIFPSSHVGSSVYE